MTDQPTVKQAMSLEEATAHLRVMADNVDVDGQWGSPNEEAAAVVLAVLDTMRQRRLTDAEVVRLREKRAAGVAQTDLGREFGISQSHVSLLVTGRKRPEAGGPIQRAGLYCKATG